MDHEKNLVKSPDDQSIVVSGSQNKILDQKADLSAIMHFNADRRFSITE